MKRIAFVVEGKTEESFVNRILRGELANAQLTVILTNSGKGGGKFTVPYVLKHIKPLLGKGFDCITTMVDLHKFQNPGRKSDAKDIQKQLADAVEKKKRDNKRLDNTLFLPYVQKYEFEALLFADRQAISKHLGLKPRQRKKLENIDGDPEDINHDMPPSKWLCDIHPYYNKRFNGIKITQKIEFARIEQKCPHFAKWLARLREVAKE